MKDDLIRVRKIKGNYFLNTDAVELEITINKTVPAAWEAEEIMDKCPELIEEIKTILCTGPTWEFNPTNAPLYEASEDIIIDEKKLLEYITENIDCELKELDINKNVAAITLPVSLLIANVRSLPEDIWVRSDYCVVKTIFGEVDL